MDLIAMTAGLAAAIFWALAAALGAMVGYLLLLTAVAWFARRTTPARGGAPTTRFAVLAPAHDEEALLPDLLASLRAQDYPRELFDVHVVADNCTDATAQVARDGGAVAHERTNLAERGKGYALQWLLERLLKGEQTYDAFVVLDADSVVSPNFLRVMDARLARGERAIQAYYAVRDPARSWGVGLRYAALAVLHYLRPIGRTTIGGTAGLKGNGMVFTADLLQRHAWTSSLTEDIEFHMALVLSGERVTFAPDAVVEAEMPDTLAAAGTQNARWERGRLESARTYVPPLLRMALKGGGFVPLDAAAEHVIPPFSIVAALSVAATLAALAIPGEGWGLRVAVAAAILLGQVVYLLSGLALARAPRRVYLAMLYAPLFIAWKIQLYARVLLGRKAQGWVRTARNTAAAPGGANDHA